MQQCSPAPGALHPGRTLFTALLLALALTLSLFLGQARAVELEDTAESVAEDPLAISLEVREANEPNLEEQFFFFLATERYFLTLDGELLAAAETEEELTQLVQDTVQGYLTEDTVSCELADPEQLTLCHGYVSPGANTDLEAAAEQLEQELSVLLWEVREETVPYEHIQKEDEERYEDEEPIVTRGSDGLNRITTERLCQGGETRASSVVDTEVLAPVVDEVTVVGTKERPEYIWPASGRISSRFGRRKIAVGSSNHKGIDIAVSYGSDIVAAKAGTVIYAQWNSGGYGYLVKIEHEDGDVTYYAHNSSLVVEKGDYVEQGQVIAKAGSTGRSSGTHCHFEIRIDGTPVNPEDYLE